MKVGDIIYHKQSPERIGIIVEINSGMFATWFRVLWSDGWDRVIVESEEVGAISEKRRSGIDEGRVEDHRH